MGGRRYLGSGDVHEGDGADLEVALEVFRLCLPERFGRWNSIWRRFHRLSRAGVFEDFIRHAGGFERHGASENLDLPRQFKEPVIQCVCRRVGGGHGDAIRIFRR